MSASAKPSMNMALIKGLTYVMFAMFAMTTDSVGIIIPQIVKTFGLSLTAGVVSVRHHGRHRSGRILPWTFGGPIRA